MQYAIRRQSGNKLKQQIPIAHDKNAEIRFAWLSTPYPLLPVPQSPDSSILK
jgi:hypothetical protein